MARHILSRRDARRVAVRAQWLHRERPAGLLELVRQLTLLQIDPTAAIAPSADLVVWSADPVEEIDAVVKPVLVMKGGEVVGSGLL